MPPFMRKGGGETFFPAGGSLANSDEALSGKCWSRKNCWNSGGDQGAYRHG